MRMMKNRWSIGLREREFGRWEEMRNGRMLMMFLWKSLRWLGNRSYRFNEKQSGLDYLSMDLEFNFLFLFFSSHTSSVFFFSRNFFFCNVCRFLIRYTYNLYFYKKHDFSRQHG